MLRQLIQMDSTKTKIKIDWIGFKLKQILKLMKIKTKTKMDWN